MVPIALVDVQRLRKVLTSIAREQLHVVADGMRKLAGRPLATPRVLMDYHDVLLFVLAFPRDRRHVLMAQAELERIAGLAITMSSRNAAHRFALTNSGIAGTRSFAYYSIDLVRWLAGSKGAGATLDSLDGDEEAVRGVLSSIAIPAERDAFEDARTSTLERVELAAGANTLAWLVGAIDATSPSPAVRNALWNTCLPNVRLQDPDRLLTRTWCRGLSSGIQAFPDGYRTKVDFHRTCARRLQAPVKLTREQREELVTAVRGALIGHLRETDTATLCSPDTVELHDMGQGISVALLTLPPGRRTQFDGYIGYVAFANAVPVAYGGAWIFPGKSKVGINVFPAFRGGPSALLFASILRCYAQRYDVGCFEADNYQLGHGNADGIRSGAYWFYYRAGFRTVDKELAAIAERERAVMDRDGAHRTEPRILRKLASQPMRLFLRKEKAPVFEPVDLSEAVFRHVSALAWKDRADVAKRCAAIIARSVKDVDMSSWSEAERHSFLDLAPAVAIIPDLARWPAKDKQDLLLLMRAKGLANEVAYLMLLRNHKRLLDAWSKLADGTH